MVATRLLRIRRDWRVLLLACAVAACGQVDKILEGNVPTTDRLYVGLPSTGVSIHQGSELTLATTVTRIGAYRGDVLVTVEGLPQGVTAVVGSGTTLGQVTTLTVTLRVDAVATLGTYTIKVRGHAETIPDATSDLQLVVTPPPAYVATISTPSLAIVSGGIAPLALRMTRTNFTSPVAWTLEGAAGITATFDANPVAGDSAQVTVAVAANVAPGTYSASFRGKATPLADQLVPLTVVVGAERLQLIAAAQVTTPQGSPVTASIIVNRNNFAGMVTLTAEGLPTGVTASFQPASVTANASAITLTPGPGANVGGFPVTLRATGSGVPDATTQIVLNVTAASIAVALTPDNVSILQGTNATSALTITRTAFPGVVSLGAEGLPAGVTVTIQPSSGTGSTAALTIAASSSVVTGTYGVTIRATPQGLSPSASKTATLTITVRAAPGTGNVLLDWSGCTVPDWVAWQDGTGAWNQASPAAGVVRFTVSAGRGAFAYAERDKSLSVRYMTQAELTGQPIQMCPPPAGTKRVFGTGVHFAPGESFIYQLGGGAGASSGTNPNFFIANVKDGRQDLVGWATVTLRGLRVFLRRDVDLPHDGNLGDISFTGPESFAPLQRNIGVAGTSGESLAYSMSYLTTPACVVNSLYGSVSGTTLFAYGIPDSAQRADDYHMLTVTASAPGRVRTLSNVFHSMGSRTVALPALTVVPGLRDSSVSYKRLQVGLGAVPASYNGAATLRYDDGARVMSVSLSSALFTAPATVVTMPELSGVSGWSSAFAIAASARGNYSVLLDGRSVDGPLCTEARSTFTITYSGSF